MSGLIFNKLRNTPLFPISLVCVISLFGILILWSINGGNMHPWGINQLIRLGFGLGALFVAYCIPFSFWKKYAFLLYLGGVCLLIVVIVMGKVSMGAQRWISMFSFNFQPSEMMRVFLVFALAKYFSNRRIEEMKYNLTLVPPIFLIFLPMAFVLLQPDLGTSMMFICVGVSLFFICGTPIWKFLVAFLGIAIASPFLWNLLHDYQKARILMFFSPEKDPSGAGYHIIQSQIALGSGGFWGKGLLNGSQSQLNFLPEKQTDFVFAALGEELGFAGCLLLIFLYLILIGYNFYISAHLRYKFPRLVVFGLNAMLFFYVFINISMVCGLLPVVGIPLPFFSYGGSAMVVLMFCQGIIFSAGAEEKERNSLLG